MRQTKNTTATFDPAARPFAAWLCRQISEKQVALGHSKWSLRKIAAKAGITNQYLSQLMSAKRPWCSNEVAAKIAKAVGASSREAVAHNMLQRARCFDERERGAAVGDRRTEARAS